MLLLLFCYYCYFATIYDAVLPCILLLFDICVFVNAILLIIGHVFLCCCINFMECCYFAIYHHLIVKNSC